jgi:hypothetical protein
LSLNRLCLAAIAVASCGGEPRERVTLQAPQTAPRASASSHAEMPEPACLAALEGEKPIDKKTLESAELAKLPEPERSFAVARVYFDSEHWVDAAKTYRAIAFEHADSDVGIYASQLYLECLNQLGVHAGRARCYDDMARDAAALRDVYCAARRSKNEEMCATLEKIQLDVERLRASRLMEEGAAKGDASLVHASGDALLAMLRAHCLPQTSPAARCDETAYNAAIAFIASGDEPAAKRVQAMMLDPKNGMSKSPLVPKLECRLDPARRASWQ